MYQFTIKNGWESVSRVFVAEDVEDELFQFGFYKLEKTIKVEDGFPFELILFENQGSIITQKFLLHLSFEDVIHEIIIPELPDLLACLKELRTSLTFK